MFRLAAFALTVLSVHGACPDCKPVTTAALIVDKLPEKVSPILTDKVEKAAAPSCGCEGKPKCPCWKPATMVDKLPEDVPVSTSAATTCDCNTPELWNFLQEEECPSKCDNVKEEQSKPLPCDCQKKECPATCPEKKYQKPKMVDQLLPENKPCDCKSKKIVSPKCGCPKLKTPCGCQTCPCIKLENPDIVHEKEIPCDKLRFRSLRSGKTLPPRCGSSHGGKRL